MSRLRVSTWMDGLAMNDESLGSCCPECNSVARDVIISRMKSNGVRYRRSQCVKCNARFTTYEVAEDHYLKFAEYAMSTDCQLQSVIVDGLADAVNESDGTTEGIAEVIAESVRRELHESGRFKVCEGRWEVRHVHI